MLQFLPDKIDAAEDPIAMGCGVPINIGRLNSSSGLPEQSGYCTAINRIYDPLIKKILIKYDYY